jgi:hypothetical protein
MTTPTSTDTAADTSADSPGDDQAVAEFSYGHGRMPFFMKLVWLAFLAFGSWYVVSFLLRALDAEIG